MTQKTVLITGAAKRIGRAIALDMASNGWYVIVHYNQSETEAQDLAHQIKKNGGFCDLIRADLGKESEVQSIFPLALNTINHIDCLINNASTFFRDTLQSSTRESWDAHLEPNLRAPFVLSQAFANQFLNSKRQSGTIINIIDQCVWNLPPDFTSYTVSKYGLWGLTQSLARSLAPHIRVNGIGPGPTLQNQHQSHRDFEKTILDTPLQVGPSLKEICATVQYILETPSLTGQMIALDGGQHLGK